MAEIKWIKLSVNMFDDEKIKLIRTMPEGDSIIIIWVQMLCLAGKINDSGAVYMGQNLAYSDEMLATILGHPVNVMRAALQTLEQFEMIETNDGGQIEIINWEKHQNIDGMERIRKQNRDRKKRFDLRKKLEQLGYDPNAGNVPNDIKKLKKYVELIEAKSSNAIETFGNVTDEFNTNSTEESNQEPHSNSNNVSSKSSNVTVTSSNATDKNRIEEEKKREEKKEISTTTTEKKEKNSSGGKLPSKNVFGTWEELWMFPNLVQKEILVELSEKYSDELVVAAIKVAGANDVIKGRAINFIEAVLKEWEDNNVETIEQARTYTKNRNKGKGNRNFNKQPRKQESLPEWEEDTSEADEIIDDDLGSRLEELRKMREEE